MSKNYKPNIYAHILVKPETKKRFDEFIGRRVTFDKGLNLLLNCIEKCPVKAEDPKFWAMPYQHR